MIDILCKKIVRQLAINRIVETGTDKGETVAETSRWFSEFYSDFGQIVRNEKSSSRSYRLGNEPIIYPVFNNVQSGNHRVYSVDIDEHSYQSARERFKSNPNMHIGRASSDVFLTSLLTQEVPENNNYLFF